MCSQSDFEAAVLAVVGEALETDRRLDLVADDYLRHTPIDRVDPDIRADLIICASEIMGQMTTLIHDRRLVRSIIPAVGMAADLPAPSPSRLDSRIQTTLRRLTQAFLQARRHFP